MALAAANALLDEKHKDQPYHNGTETSWAKERNSEHPFHYKDGVHIWVSKYDLTPDADWI